MALYTQYGVEVTLVGADRSGQVQVQAVGKAISEAIIPTQPWRAWRSIGDLKADGGIAEVLDAISKLREQLDLPEDWEPS